eukprot:3671714-Amphidinium_carterae.1
MGCTIPIEAERRFRLGHEAPFVACTTSEAVRLEIGCIPEVISMANTFNNVTLNVSHRAGRRHGGSCNGATRGAKRFLTFETCKAQVTPHSFNGSTTKKSLQTSN